MTRHPLHWATLAAHQVSDRRTARLQALLRAFGHGAVIAAVIAGVIGLAYTARFLAP